MAANHFVSAIVDACRTHVVASRLALRFDPASLQRELDSIDASKWQPYVGPHYDSGRYLSFSVAGTPHFADVVAAFPSQVRMARLNKLLPGGQIARHRDNNVPRDFVRIHVPLRTGDNVDFLIDDTRLPMESGECWMIDPRFAHEVYNRGTSERTHLIIDLRKSAALDELLAPGQPLRRRFLTDYFAAEFRDRVRRKIVPQPTQQKS